MRYEKIIIGTGFASHYVSNQILGSSVLMIQPKVADGELVNVISTDSSVFEISQFLKTQNFGGGKAVWGGAISFPNTRNYFKETENIIWNKIGQEIIKVNLADNQSTKEETALLRIFPGIKDYLEIEQHGYLTGSLSSFSNYKFPENSQRDVLEGAITAIKVLPSGSYMVTLITVSGSLVELESQEIILAAGNILNACYVSLLTGHKIFPIGNHCSKKLGEIFFVEPMKLINIAQTYSPNETKFLTIGNNGFSPNFNGTNNSIRLQVTDTVSAQRSAFEYLVKGILVGDLKRKMRIIRSICHAIIFSERLISKATIRLMTDQPSDHDNYLEVIRQRNGKWELKIKLELDSNVMQDSLHLHQIIAESLSKSECVRDVYLPSLRTDKTNKILEYAWHDAAHYYGSIPAKSSNAHSPAVDENLQLQGFVNCFVVGSSAFPIGSHGHPTKLIMDLAVRLGVYLNEKTSSRSQ